MEISSADRREEANTKTREAQHAAATQVPKVKPHSLQSINRGGPPPSRQPASHPPAAMEAPGRGALQATQRFLGTVQCGLWCVGWAGQVAGCVRPSRRRAALALDELAAGRRRQAAAGGGR